MSDENWLFASARRAPWDKGKLVGAKPPLRSSQVRSIRTRLLIERRAEACSAFTRVTACTLALSPYIVTRYPKASATSFPP
jgi:hypothetical protein